uniref:CSON012135 protein n=1 Tax=Culicoides sonorensis TaxID=179676 RepID=A0A336M4R5_CULSO
MVQLKSVNLLPFSLNEV